MDTIEYYNQYATKIFEDTVEKDTEEIRNRFLKYLEEGDTILDLGCGSGRDSLAFYEMGYDVTPLDASEEMCKLAEIHTGLDVLNMSYEEMEFDEVFDGVWGCEALIHVPEDEMDEIMNKIADALCPGGVLFLSFMEGDFEGFKGSRYFSEYTQERLERLLKRTERLETVKIWKTEDETKEGRVWLNVIAKRTA